MTAAVMMKALEVIQDNGVVMQPLMVWVRNLPVASASSIGLSSEMCLRVAARMLVELLTLDCSLRPWEDAMMKVAWTCPGLDDK